jgi:hypothetical protein
MEWIIALMGIVIAALAVGLGILAYATKNE